MKKLIIILVLGVILVCGVFAEEWIWIMDKNEYRMEFNGLDSPAILYKNGKVFMNNLTFLMGEIKANDAGIYSGVWFFKDKRGNYYSLSVVNGWTMYYKEELK